MTGATAPVDVRVVIPDHASGEGESIHDAARTALIDLVRQFELAVPLEPSISIDRGARVAVLINGVLCRMHAPDYLLRYRSSLADEIGQTVHAHAALIVTPEVAEAIWIASIGKAASMPPWFRTLVEDLVHHRVRPARLQPLLGVTSESKTSALFEKAIRAAGGPIRIVVDERTHQAFSEGEEDFCDLLSFLAYGLFAELGIPLAVPQYGVDPSLPDHHFAVELNDLRTLPLPGIRAHEILVNDTRDRLKLMDVDGDEVMNPETGQPAVITSRSHKQDLEDSGATVWSMSGYIILTVAELVRRHASSLYCPDLLTYQLSELGEEHSLLLSMVERIGGVVRLTRILRRLLREEIPIKDLPSVISALHSAPPSSESEPSCVTIVMRHHRAFVVASPEVGDVFEASLAQTARNALSRRIAHKYTRGTTTLVVYLLDPQLVNRLLDPAEITIEERRAILDMIREEMSYLPKTAQRPVILTRAAIRARLRFLIEVEQPKLAVLAYEELVPDLNIQPVARLTLTT